MEIVYRGVGNWSEWHDHLENRRPFFHGLHGWVLVAVCLGGALFVARTFESPIAFPAP
jgi:hypothetical protein